MVFVWMKKEEGSHASVKRDLEEHVVTEKVSLVYSNEAFKHKLWSNRNIECSIDVLYYMSCNPTCYPFTDLSYLHIYAMSNKLFLGTYSQENFF